MHIRLRIDMKHLCLLTSRECISGDQTATVHSEALDIGPRLDGGYLQQVCYSGSQFSIGIWNRSLDSAHS